MSKLLRSRMLPHSNWLLTLVYICSVAVQHVQSQPSAAPSDFPSDFPSFAPSGSPTTSRSPSNPPSLSAVPTTTPTVFPSTTPSTSPSQRDDDQDGFPASEDCNDNDPTINRDRPEICGDGIDNNCNGETDELPCLADADGDEWFVVTCAVPGDAECLDFTTRFEPDTVDCDDTTSVISPSAPEVCGDGIDNNCDGVDDTCPVTTSAPSSSPSDAPSAAPSVAPSVSPSQSAAPSPRATQSPTPVPSAMPSSTVKPSAEPSVSSAPSTVPSVEPSHAPSASPSTSSPVVSLPTTTSSPTQAPSTASPTPSLVTVTQTFRNLNIELVGIDEELGPEATDVFAQELVQAFDTFYNTNPATRLLLRRSLVAQSVVSDVETTIDVVGQQVRTNDQNDPVLVVLFDQTLAYKIPSTAQSDVSAIDVVSEPLQDSNVADQFSSDLIVGHPEFSSLATVSSVTLPSGPTPSSNDNNEDDGDSGLDLGIIIAIAAAGGAVVVGAIVVLALRRKRDKMGHESLPATIDPPPRNELMGGEDVSMVSDNNTYDETKSALRGDQSIETIDYDYSKAYGGGEQSVVSSAGGTLGDNTREAGSQALASNVGGRAALGASFDSDGAGNNSATAQEPIVQEQTIQICAPPGKLGVVIDTPNSGAPVVHAVKDSSVIANLISVGDQLIMVDDIDVSDMTAIKVSKLISKKSANPQRKLTIVRKVVIEPGDAQ